MFVRIGGRKYQIIEQVLQVAHDENYGMCDKSRRKIYINPEYCRKDTHHANVLIHELFHALYDVYNIHDQDDEERTVTTLANGLTALLKDNPELLLTIKKYLAKD